MKRYIYGAGKYGKTLLSLFSKMCFDIDGFVQTSAPKTQMVLNKPVIQIDELSAIDDVNFFLAIKDEKIINEVKKSLADRYPKSQIINCVSFIEDNLLYPEKTVSKNWQDGPTFDEGCLEDINYRSISDMDRIIRKNISAIPLDVELIVGIPRSGMLAASIIALLLNKPLVDINSLLSEDNNGMNDMSERIKTYLYNIQAYKKILVIDDSCNSGSSLDKARECLEKFGSDVEILFGCVYATNESQNYVDFYFEIVDLPRVFEWNILNHSILNDACLDLDGVLCVDPTDEENDDGEKYINFILNATPLFIPRTTIGYIVTSRLEKYRKETEAWLGKNGIKYKKLYMLDLKSKEERIKQNAHSKFKAEIYQELKAKLFVESNANQAKEIYEMTNRDVYCIENNVFYHRDWSKK